MITPELAAACDMAEDQCPDMEIADCLSIQFALTDEQSARFVGENRRVIARHRSKGLREARRFHREVMMGAAGKINGTQMQAFDSFGKAYLGHGLHMDEVVRRVQKATKEQGPPKLSIAGRGA